MIKPAHFTDFEAVEAEQTRRRVLKNRVMALMVTLQISPGGREFISICGFGNERSNADAILYWLNQQIFSDESPATVNFNTIKDRFIRHMMDVIDQFPEGI
jgi:hypothetical protein